MIHDIYLDGNATSAVLPAALEAAVRAMQHSYGNPSSTHATGLVAKTMLDAARQRAVRMLGVGAGRLMFNSGATEGIQTAVLSALCALRERKAAGTAVGSLLLYGATEHKAVPESLAHWNRLLGLNLELKALPVDADGRHDLLALRALAPQLAFLCTMAANNETGVVSDLAGIAAVLERHAGQALWMVDCVQALGKLELDLAASRIDYAPFSGHKLYAPKGVGMLYVRAGAPFTPLVMGGGQEAGLRSGTENMAGIAALDAVLAALEQGEGGPFRSHAELAGLRDRLAGSLRRALPGLLFNAPLAHALPTTLNFSVPGVSARELMDVFDAAGVRVSAGSACSAAKAAPSVVLDAMGLPLWRSSNAIRMSFGPAIDAATIAEACARIERCGAALAASGLLPSAARAPAAAPLHDGVLQLGSGAACSWLVLDAASRGCIVIDPQPGLAERIESTVRRQGYRVLAILGTTPGADLHTLRQAVRVPDVQDAFGWAGWDSLTLGDGQSYTAMALGAQALVRVPCGSGQVSYLLGHASARQLGAGAVRFAFTGTAPAQELAALVDADTVLCAARDEHQPICSSLRAEAAAAGLNAGGMHLDAQALGAFLQAHPEARLIDVREAYEHAAGARVGPGGRAAHNVPLSRLASEIAGWLRAAPVPLVFFCRSGNRSSKAAHCLRRLGYGPAFHLAGGIAHA